MIDSLQLHRESARSATATLAQHGVGPELLQQTGGYGVVTLHRPSNVDRADDLRAILAVLRDVSERLPLVFAMHPRTRTNIERFGLGDMLDMRPDGHPAAAGLSRDARPDGRRDSGPHRLGRLAGGDDRPRRAVPDPARQHRASHHRRTGHEHDRQDRPQRDPRRCRRDPRGSRQAWADCPSCGTAMPPTASPPTWRTWLARRSNAAIAH